MKTLLLVVAVLIVAVGAYFYLSAPTAQAPAQTTTTEAETPVASSSDALPSNVGATDISNPNAPAGSAAECARCDQYAGAQKAECLVALNCK